MSKIQSRHVFFSILFLNPSTIIVFIVWVLTYVAFSHCASLRPLRYAGCYAFAPAGDGVTVGYHSFLLCTSRGPVTILVMGWVLPTTLLSRMVQISYHGWWAGCFTLIVLSLLAYIFSLVVPMLCILLPYFGREIYTVALYCVVCFLHPCYTALGIYLSALGSIAVLMGHCTSSRSGRLLVVLGSICASLGILWMVPFAHLLVCVGLGFSY